MAAFTAHFRKLQCERPDWGFKKKKENIAYSAANMCTMQRHTIKLVSPMQTFSGSRLKLKPIVVLFIYSSLLVCLATPTVSYIFDQK